MSTLSGLKIVAIAVLAVALSQWFAATSAITGPILKIILGSYLGDDPNHTAEAS